MSRFTATQILSIFNSSIDKTTLVSWADSGKIPKPEMTIRGKSQKIYTWPESALPDIGSKIGFLEDLVPSFKNGFAAVTVYTKKGGVGKTTLAYHLARTAALHGIKTCIVGLDSQCDITRLLGYYDDIESIESLQEYEKALSRKKGLYHLYTNKASYEEVVQKTSLKTLDYIPETDEIDDLVTQIESMTRREYFISDKIIPLLKQDYNLVIFDCSPTSGRLVQNAINASNMVISPVGCSTNNWRNISSFIAFLQKLKNDLQKDNLKQLMVPVMLKNTAISSQIYAWYSENLKSCYGSPIRYSNKFEESSAYKQCVYEFAPTDEISMDVRDIMKGIFAILSAHVEVKKPLLVSGEKKELLNNHHAQL